MEGNIKIKIVIEVLGSPKEYVEKALDKVIERLKSEYKVLNHVAYETLQINQFWSTFADVELIVKDIDEVIGLVFDYMPSSIEIIEPDIFNFKSNEIMNIINDLIARLHQYDMVVKNLRAELLMLKKKQG